MADAFKRLDKEEHEIDKLLTRREKKKILQERDNSTPRSKNTREPEAIISMEKMQKYRSSLNQLRQRKLSKIEQDPDKLQGSFSKTIDRCDSLDNSKSIRIYRSGRSYKRRPSKLSLKLGFTVTACDIKPQISINLGQTSMRSEVKKISLSSLFKAEPKLTASHNSSLMQISQITPKILLSVPFQEVKPSFRQSPGGPLQLGRTARRSEPAASQSPNPIYRASSLADLIHRRLKPSN